MGVSLFILPHQTFRTELSGCATRRLTINKSPLFDAKISKSYHMEPNPARKFEEGLLQRATGCIFGRSMGVMMSPKTGPVSRCMFSGPFPQASLN